MAATALERIREALADTGDGRAVALGWATVELDRAAQELAEVLDLTPDAFADADDSIALGARCRVAAGVLPGGLSLAILEPGTEGRLAATLARFGEGPAAIWSTTDTSGAPDDAISGPGPFGRERLVSGTPRQGPYRFLIGTATGTIRSMTDQATILLRPAQPTDAEGIATMFTDEGYPAGPSDIVVRLERFATAHSRVIVAEHDGALLGFIAIHALPRFEHDDWIVRILALVVDAGARERGVGRTLMAEAERIGRELGAAFIELTAGHHRPEARHLYESLGYDSSVTGYLRKKL